MDCAQLRQTHYNASDPSVSDEKIRPAKHKDRHPIGARLPDEPRHIFNIGRLDQYIGRTTDLKRRVLLKRLIE
jgi:hypothetical protein